VILRKCIRKNTASQVPGTCPTCTSSTCDIRYSVLVLVPLGPNDHLVQVEYKYGVLRTSFLVLYKYTIPRALNNTINRREWAEAWVSYGFGPGTAGTPVHTLHTSTPEYEYLLEHPYCQRSKVTSYGKRSRKINHQRVDNNLHPRPRALVRYSMYVELSTLDFTGGFLCSCINTRVKLFYVKKVLLNDHFCIVTSKVFLFVHLHSLFS
jgi:hypothetical protein